MKAKYAIQALVCIASSPPKTSFVARKIAEMENIPQKFLEEILLDLRKEGILFSKIGKCGGYYLQLPAASVNLKNIFQAINDPLAANARNASPERLDLDHHDLVEPIRIKLVEAQNRVLESITLEDLVKLREEQMQQALSVPDFQI